MQPDGTITYFYPRSLWLGGCSPVSDSTVSGAVTHSDMYINIAITITDRDMCRDIFGPGVHNSDLVRDTDRTFTISVSRLVPVSAS